MKFRGKRRVLALSGTTGKNSGGCERGLRRQRLHLVDGRPHLAALAGETRLIAHLPFLEHLRSLGEAAAEIWWDLHGGQLGRTSTLDLARLLAGVPA